MKTAINRNTKIVLELVLFVLPSGSPPLSRYGYFHICRVTGTAIVMAKISLSIQSERLLDLL